MKLILILLVVGGVALCLFSWGKDMTVWEYLRDLKNRILLSGAYEKASYLPEEETGPKARLRFGDVEIDLLMKGLYPGSEG